MFFSEGRGRLACILDWRGPEGNASRQSFWGRPAEGRTVAILRQPDVPRSVTYLLRNVYRVEVEVFGGPPLRKGDTLPPRPGIVQ